MDIDHFEENWTHLPLQAFTEELHKLGTFGPPSPSVQTTLTPILPH